jgi:tetratricopeptide (TPR) repeat protein
VVQYGLTDNADAYGTAQKMPWRAGANENTVLTVSHDVRIQGKDLPAGSYGLHLIPAEKGPWTLILSHDYQAWGSYFYDEAKDALRVEVAPQEAPFHEWLTFEFTERDERHAVCALMWENLQVPFRIDVPQLMDLYYEQIAADIRLGKGYSHQGFVEAANFCLAQQFHIEQGLVWAELALSDPYVGRKAFGAYQAKAGLLELLGRQAEADAAMQEALPQASMNEIHGYGRALLANGRKEEALKVFQLNRERHPNDAFTTLIGLARGYSGVGNYPEAAKQLALAIPQAPAPQQPLYRALLEKLEKGQDIN